MQKIVKFFITIIMIFGILLSNIPYYVVSSFVDSYIQTRGIVDKAWFAQQNDGDVVDTFSTLKEFSNKFKAYEAMAAVSYNSNGAFAYSASGGTSVSPAYPASIAVYDLLILTIGMKPSVANGGSVTTPGGWTPIVSLTGAGGYGTTLGADTGNTNLFTFYKVAAGTETGNLAVTIATNGVSWAQISRLSNASGSWSVAGTTGSDTSAGSVSIAFGADPGVTGGDYVIGAMTIPTNVTTPAQFSAEAFSQSGITFGTVTEIGEADSGTGNDIGGFRVRAPVSSGTSAGVPTMTATAGGTTTNVRGPGAFIRVRESNTAPTLTVAQPDGTGDTVTVGDPYNITYDLADPDPKHAVTAAMYYDADASGLNGTAITGACATAAEGTGATCSWDTTGMTPGTYYVYGITNDGIAAQVSDYSSGVITINAPANSSPTLSIAQPDGTGDTVNEGDSYNITYTLADTDNVVTAAFYYDTDAVGLNGTAITGACATAAEGSGVTCSWNTTGVTPGSYYVYGITNDGVNPQVSAYSSGVITINAITVTAAATGTQNTNLDSGATSQYIGAAFTFKQNAGTADIITALTISDVGGTVIANTDLSNALLRYEQPVSATCTYDGTETATGTVSFNASDQAVFSGLSIPVTVHATNVTCVYLVFNLVNATNYPKGGQTIEPQITASADFTLSGGTTKAGTYPVVLSGSTTVLPNATSVTYQSGLSASDGGQSGYTATITGYGFGAAPDASQANCSGAVNTGCVRFTDGPATVADADVATAWTNTQIQFTVNANLAAYGGASTLEVVAGGQSDATDLTFYIYPNISSIVNHSNVVDGNYAREYYDTSDGEGILKINGDHFGTSGTVQILSVNVLDADEDNTTSSSDPAACAGSAYTDTCVRVRVPSSIADNLYAGNLKITRDGPVAGKDYVWIASAFRIFPRITALNPSTGIAGDPITIEGNHFCQSGTCPISPDRNTTDNNITFNGGTLIVPDPSDVTGWTDAVSPNTITINIPTGAATGNVQIESDVDGIVNDLDTATSNTISFTLGNATPASAANIKQCTNGSSVANCNGSLIPTNSTTTASTIYFMMDMQVGTSGGTLCPQIELKLVSVPFDETSLNTGGDCQTSVVANTVYTKILSVTPADGNYHWRARVKHTKNSTDYYSASWTPFPEAGENDPTYDFKKDTNGPVIAFNSATAGEFTAKITWTTDENATSNIEYQKPSGTIFTAPEPVDDTKDNTSHSVLIDTNLKCGISNYSYKIKSKDAQNNETICDGVTSSSSCPSPGTYGTFNTSSCANRIMRSVESLVVQKENIITLPLTNDANQFGVYLEELNPVFQNAYIEISGVSSGNGDLTVSARVDKCNDLGCSSVTQGVGRSYVLLTSTTPQPFKIRHPMMARNLFAATSGCPGSCPNSITTTHWSNFVNGQSVALTDASGSPAETNTISSVNATTKTITFSSALATDYADFSTILNKEFNTQDGSGSGYPNRLVISLSGGPTNVSLFGAKAIVTYYYSP